MVKQVITWIFFLLFFVANSYGNEQSDMKQKIQKALQSTMLSPFEIPFETYITAGLWDELFSVFHANVDKGRSYTLPGIYYSRPYIINNTVWVFANQIESADRLHVFDVKNLKKIEIPFNDEYLYYEGGIRHIYRKTVISGASDKNVDTAVLWDTETNTIQTVSIQEGHYITSIQVDGKFLYIGTCGGVINVWQFDDLAFNGIYTVHNTETADWNQFNKRECIVGVHVYQDQLYGAGERTIFVWNLKTKSFIKSYPKAISNSTVSFHKGLLLEYSENYVTVTRLEDGVIIHEIKTTHPIDDLIVTSEKLIGEYSGDLIILSLRHNNGFLFYDGLTYQPIKTMTVKGMNLCAYGNYLLATDDRHLYSYQALHHNPDKFNEFVKRMDLNKIPLTDDNFYQLIKLSQLYPDYLPFDDLTKRFFQKKKIMLDYSIKVGRIGKQGDNHSDNSRGSVGYKGLYQVTNLSNEYYFMTMTAQGKGSYGIPDRIQSDISRESPIQSFYEKSFFITPDANTFSDSFDIGEKEPRFLFLYPAQIRTITKPYYDGFVQALSQENKNLDLLDIYLADDMLIAWRNELEERKKQLIQDKGKLYRFFRAIRKIF